MKVTDQILKSVAFIGCKTVQGEYLLKGSVFFVGRSYQDDDRSKVFDIEWVTARHVIDGIRALGCTEVHVRLNTKSGGSRWHSTRLDNWFYLPDDPTCDIAVYRSDIPHDADHLTCGPDEYLSDATATRLALGPTDEVLVVGMFHPHAGSSRNLPIIRLGSIASMDTSEPVATRYGRMPVYLIECRSIGGLSGSPVFVLTGIERSLNGALAIGESTIYLLGLIHGHFDVKEANIDDIDAASGLKSDQVNTGIAMVTPFERLRTVFNAHEEHLKKTRVFDPVEYTRKNLSLTVDPVGRGDITVTIHREKSKFALKES
jgi:hypothetical protein